jgi:hypothetical protein
LEKYTEVEWIDKLVGDIGLDWVLEKASNLEPDRAKLVKKLTEIANPEMENVNARIWDLLAHRVSIEFAGNIFTDVVQLMPDNPESLNFDASRRLAGVLAERIQAEEGGPQC